MGFIWSSIQLPGILYNGKPQPSVLTSGTEESLDLTVTCQYCTDTGHIKDNCLRLQQKVAHEKLATQSIIEQEALQSNQPVKTPLKEGLVKVENL